MTEETMMERLVRKIGEVPANMQCDVRTILTDCAVERIAKAALEAIREPSEDIIDAGWEGAISNEGASPEACWPAMIDAILQERA